MPCIFFIWVFNMHYLHYFHLSQGIINSYYNPLTYYYLFTYPFLQSLQYFPIKKYCTTLFFLIRISLAFVLQCFQSMHKYTNALRFDISTTKYFWNKFPICERFTIHIANSFSSCNIIAILCYYTKIIAYFCLLF